MKLTSVSCRGRSVHSICVYTLTHLTLRVFTSSTGVRELFASGQCTYVGMYVLELVDIVGTGIAYMDMIYMYNCVACIGFQFSRYTMRNRSMGGHGKSWVWCCGLGPIAIKNPVVFRLASASVPSWSGNGQGAYSSSVQTRQIRTISLLRYAMCRRYFRSVSHHRTSQSDHPMR